MMSGRLLTLVFGLCVALCASPVAAQEAEDATSDATAVAPTGLTGHVVLALRCPVPLGGDDDGAACGARPLLTTLSLRSADGLSELAQVTTDANGAFSVALDPGSYIVAVASREVPVTVTAEGMTEVTISVQPSPRLP
jgi:hypothetical protein